MRPFSLDLRHRVLVDYKAGLCFAELGRKYSTSAEWVRQFIRRYQATGEVAARPPIPKKVPFHRRHEAELRAAIAERPDLTLEGLQARLGIEVSIATLHNSLRALKLSFKKNSGRGRAGPAGGRRRTRGVPDAATGRPRSASVRVHR